MRQLGFDYHLSKLSFILQPSATIHFSGSCRLKGMRVTSTLASFYVFSCDMNISIFSRNVIFLLGNGLRRNDGETISDVSIY